MFKSGAQMRAALQSEHVTLMQILRRGAAERGEFYLNEARRYLRRGNSQNAVSSVNEGLRTSAGPFYIAVRDELEVLRRQLQQEIHVQAS